MSDRTKSNLLSVAVLGLTIVEIWGDVDGWAIWALVAVQLLLVAVAFGIFRSGEVPS